MAKRSIGDVDVAALQADIRAALNESGRIPSGVREKIADKFGISLAMVSWYKKKLGSSSEHARSINSGKRNKFVGLNEDILAGKTEQEIRQKYAIPADGRVKPVGRQAPEEMKPMSKEECMKVAKLLTKLAEVNQAAFTSLDIVGNISRKYPRIWSELL